MNDVNRLNKRSGPLRIIQTALGCASPLACWQDGLALGLPNIKKTIREAALAGADQAGKVAIRPSAVSQLVRDLSQTGRSALTLKVGNVATISMVTAPAVDQYRVLTGGSLGEKNFTDVVPKSGPSIGFPRFTLPAWAAVKSETGVQREPTIVYSRLGPDFSSWLQPPC